jgi:(2Fe-2S) ferredoxin
MARCQLARDRRAAGQGRDRPDRGQEALSRPASPRLLAKARASLAESGGATVERQIFLCALPTKAKCCLPRDGEAAWQFLKARLKELDLVGPGKVQRTKADCLQVCAAGPIALIWPDRVYYHSCSPEVLERVIQQHLILGVPVEEFRLYPEG